MARFDLTDAQVVVLNDVLWEACNSEQASSDEIKTYVALRDELAEQARPQAPSNRLPAPAAAGVAAELAQAARDAEIAGALRDLADEMKAFVRAYEAYVDGCDGAIDAVRGWELRARALAAHLRDGGEE